MSFQTLEYVKTGRICKITLDTSLSDTVYAARQASELNEICTLITQEEDVSVTIITGSGPLFSFAEGPDRINSFTLYPATALASLDCPVIAALNGDATGHAFELALAADIRLGVKGIKLGFPGVGQGKFPCDGGTQRLPRIAGKANALDLLLTGRLIDTEEAFRMGIVSDVVEPEDIQKTVNEIADQMAAGAALSLRFGKEAVVKGMELTLEQGLRLEADLYFLLHTTHDRTEGITAFKEKRPPHFTSS